MSELNILVLGGGQEVGRTAIALGVQSRYIVLDHGINFDEKDIPQFPNHIKPYLLDGMVLSHAHLDHIGAAPLIYSSVRIPTITSRLTKSLIRTMIEDFLKISGYYIPYEVNELENLLDNVIELDLGESLELSNYRIKLINAGHIPGSAMTLIELDGFNVIYTGDVNTVETKLVKPASLDGIKAEVAIIEATYGSSLHPLREDVERDFISAVREVIEDGGNVLIPVFSLGRAQEILCVLCYYLPYLTVYYDGMVRQISDILLSYPEYINRYELLTKALREYSMIRNQGERKRVIKERGVVIVASAGMLKGGPAVFYAKHLLSTSRNAIYLVSYQARGTPGRRLLEYGLLEERGSVVKARVQWFDFSSHADYEGLIKLLNDIKDLREVIVVHTNEDVGKEFVSRLTSLRNDLSVYLPRNGDSIKITL